MTTTGTRSTVATPAKRARLVDDVTARIREMILTGEVQPGEQLLQTSLSEQLGVSRTPLREAFRVLENEGLIKISNRNRTVEVVQFTTEELEDMFELREAVDGLAARSAAHHGVSAEIEARLRHLLNEMTSSERDYDKARRATAHLAFHALIAEISENPYIEAYAPLVRASSAALYYPTPIHPAAQEMPHLDDDRGSELGPAMQRMDHQHHDIVDAIIDRDPQRAEDLARNHARTTKAALARRDTWLKAMDRSRGLDLADAKPDPPKPTR